MLKTNLYNAIKSEDSEALTRLVVYLHLRILLLTYLLTYSLTCYIYNITKNK